MAMTIAARAVLVVLHRSPYEKSVDDAAILFDPYIAAAVVVAVVVAVDVTTALVTRSAAERACATT